MCSDSTQLLFLKNILCKHCYPEKFLDKCFKMILGNILIVKKRTNSGEKAFISGFSILRNNICTNYD